MSLARLSRSTRRLRRSAKRLAEQLIFGVLVGLAALAVVRSLYQIALALSGSP